MSGDSVAECRVEQDAPGECEITRMVRDAQKPPVAQAMWTSSASPFAPSSAALALLRTCTASDLQETSPLAGPPQCKPLRRFWTLLKARGDSRLILLGRTIWAEGDVPLSSTLEQRRKRHESSLMPSAIN